MTRQQTLYRQLRDRRNRLTPPPGLAWPEISDGKIVMMMSPRPRHQLTATRVRDQLSGQLTPELGVFEATDTDDEELGKLRIPDLHVCAYAAMETDDPLDPREIALAIEIVSPSNPENDYEDKARDYPAMGIPHYLILDPRDGTWTYQWEIGRLAGRPAYENRLHLPYGKHVTVTTEYGTWTIATDGLPRYSAKDMGLTP
ncbi:MULTISPECIES: Uma2 family endonuclease [unclassified Streptomyces]|uniref:Uma2 family endonuclease n=1 Tax=unclassified Streptomyces TaxID=2593676 RepID=UPI00278BD4AC|nr:MULTISPECIES: Uma2 family endonuclease [unclassified Streptomyces]